MAKPQELLYKIHKVNARAATDNLHNVVRLWSTSEVQEIVKKINEAYLPWDEFRKKSWSTEKRERIWYILSTNRLFSQKRTAIKDKDGQHYKFDPHRHTEFLHEIDLEFGGNLLGIPDFSDGDRRQVIRRNLIEESIASSKLEGANTSRETARRMLSEGRKAQTKSEQMITNNHAAMTQIEEIAKQQTMSREMLLALHREVTKGTLTDARHEGSLRETLNANGKRLVIKPWNDETIAYVTPDREFVEEQLPHFIAFANDADGSEFIHPLFKAIMLHFWIGLLHPFEDGNGRVARIVFYWYMLRKGYWAFAYLSLSEHIQKSPSQYAMAYVNTEQDSYDLNYFIQYNVEKLKLARRHLQAFAKSKIAENRQRVMVARRDTKLNTRQILLLQYLANDELRQINVDVYQGNNNIGYITAVTDLKKLVEQGFLTKKKSGRNVDYLPTQKIQMLFK